MAYERPRPRPGVMSSGDRFGQEVIKDGQITHSRPKKPGEVESNPEDGQNLQRMARTLHVPLTEPFKEELHIEEQKTKPVEVILASGESLTCIPVGASCGETSAYLDPNTGTIIDIPNEKHEVRDCG